MAEKTKAELQADLDQALARITTLEADGLKLGNDLADREKQSGLSLDEIARLEAIIGGLSPAGGVRLPVGAVEAARAELAASMPADPHGIPEAEINAKIRVGLDRSQAIHVITHQRAEDAKSKSAA